MRKTLLTLALVAGIVSTAMAVRAPLDGRGQALHTIDFVGADTCLVGVAANTNGVICSSSPVIVYGVIASSVPATNFITFRSTNVSSGFAGVSTVTVVFAQGSQSNVVSGTTSGGTVQIFKFPVPIKFGSGLHVASNALLVGPASGWTIIYRLRDASSTTNE